MKKLEEMTINEIEEYVNNEKAKVCDIKTPLHIGKNYLIRTVTMIYTGKLEKIYLNELVISNAAWVPETKRWADSCKTGEFNEVEPYPKGAQVIITKAVILDMFEVPWKLPDTQI